MHAFEGARSRALRLSILLSLVSACGGDGSRPAVPADARSNLLLHGVELVQNGSFSRGLDGWETWLQDGGDAGFTVSHGRAVVRVRTPATTDWGIQLHTHGQALTAGRAYRLRFRARADVPAVIDALVREHDSDKNGDGSPWSAYAYRTYGVSSGWAQYTAEFTMPLDDSNAGVCFFVGQATSKVLIDDVSLVELVPPPPGTELVGNGDFGERLEGWDTWLQDGGVAKFAARKGVAVVEVRSAATTARGVQMHRGDLPLFPGRLYRLSFTAWADAPRSMDVLLQENGRDVDGDGSEWSTHHRETFALGTTPGHHTATFSTAGTDAAAAISFLLGETAGRVSVDDVSLMEVEPPPPGSELVANGTFAAGLDGWATYVMDGGQAVYDAVNGEATVDIYWPASDSSSIQLSVGGLPLRAGRAYRLTFRARAEQPGRFATSIWENGSDLNGDGDPYSAHRSDWHEVGPDMAAYQVEFVMPTTNLGAGVCFSLGELTGNFTLDEVSLVELPTSTTPVQLPPTVKGQRTYPRLVNYFHRMDFAEAQIAGREDYLAQWDVIVLNPQNVADQGLDLGRIREVNPGIRILAWIPFGQSSLDMDMSTSMPDVAEYFVKDVFGQPLRWAWGGYFMNPYAGDYAFPRHVVAYVKDHYLDTGLYDGVMFDCVWNFAPRFFWSSPRGVDVNGDGDDTGQDDADYMAGVEFLLSSMREAAPRAIITGNPGDPWWDGTSYYQYVNGVMMENALGTEWRSSDWLWENQWYGYQTASGSAGATPGYTFVVADLRDGGVTQEQARVAEGLSETDQRRLRLALGMTLLGDGFFGFDRGDGNHGQLWWFPEYDVDLGMPWPDYQSPASTWQAGDGGTLRREFLNGTVVVNPTTRNTTVTFMDERRDVGTGRSGTTFDLPAHDARIYLRSCASSACIMPDATVR